MSFEPARHDTADATAVGDGNVSSAFRARKPVGGGKATARRRRGAGGGRLSLCWLN
jgi:hypothetical protein